MKTENTNRDLIRYEGKVNTTDDKHSCNVEASTELRAEEVLKNRPSLLPSFLKPMLKSNVTGGFWLVYIVRASGLAEIDGAIGLLNLDIQVKPIKTSQIEGRADIDLDSSPVNIDQEKLVIISLSESEHEADRYGNESDEFCSIIMDSTRLLESSLDFKDKKNFIEFSIHVNGLILDSEISRHLRERYYELCLSQKMYLHEHLIEWLNGKLAAGVISETINIADAIRAAKITTSLYYLESWDKTLKAFADLGMEVGFLRAWLLKLVSILRESRAVIESKKVERAKVENDIRDLEVKLLEVKGLMKKLDDEIKALIGEQGSF